uniref:N5-carboxyaminoimidazole ribonucleotide synthase n=1 Tax=Eiseniibacteriota bacterium TaxID=2212470 RepID=A0A832I0C0_UNCEI
MHENYDREILQLVRPARADSAIHPRLGIVGGGQLAKMTALAGLQLGCDVVVLERNTYSPAANLASHSIVGDWDDPEALVKLASQVDVVTLENEFVDAGSLRALEEAGYVLRPSARCIALVQDKLVQKQTLAAAGLPVQPFEAVADVAEVERAGARLGWPLLLKARRNAYDGKGNATLRSAADAPAAWRRLGGDAGRALFVEAFCEFAAELAVIVTRGGDGASVIYPVVETVQRDHVCHVVKAPAPVPAEIAARTAEVARRAAAAVGAVGSFGVEAFLTRGGDIVVNELAPRVHNSGHYTIEACLCSQFENHVRAALGWPLGPTDMVAPAAVMVNLLGAERAVGRAHGLERALAVPGAHVHVYGKAMSGAGRKMGHVTALGASLDEALATAGRAAAEIRFGAVR